MENYRNIRGAQNTRVLLLLVLVLSGCSNPVGLTSSTMVPEQEALTYFQWVRVANSDARQAERAQLLRAAAQPLRDIKLALLLSVDVDAAEAQQQQAAQLLTAAIAKASAVPEDYRVLAQHWLEVLALRDQLQQVAAQQKKSETLLAELRKQMNALEQSHAIQNETVNFLQAQKALLEQQNRLMQKQIESITAIEQQLVEQDRRKNSQP